LPASISNRRRRWAVAWSKDNLKSAAGSATLTSIFNINTDFDTTYAVDCVQVAPEPNGQMILPSLTAAVVVQGQASTQGTGISRLMYQANVEIAVGLQILVNSNLSSPNFQPTAVVQARGQWNFQLTMPTKGLGPVQLAASDPLKILQGILPASWQVPVDKAVDVSPPLLTNNVAPGLTIPVNITASFGGFTSTATLIVKGVG
jgi:hypothetical protein